jgi:RND superfamily putative drug exporter
VAAHARPVWIGTAAVLAGLALATTSLSTGLPQTASFVDPPDSVRAAALLAEHYPAGSAAPTDLFTPVGSAAAVRTAAVAVPGVASLDTGERSTSGQWVRIAVILADDPAGEAAQQTVARLRDAVHAVDAGALVGGETAEQLDQDTTMDRDLALVIPLILLIVAGVLMVLLRAVVAALLLLVSVVLSFGAALGASALIFQALGHPTIDKSLLLNGFLFLVALGVDYTIFLMTRAREETALHGHRFGVPRALAVTGGVITSAGLVLAATFSVLTLMPLVFMMQLGVLVAVGVLLDTFVVRTLLVPALVLDTGRRSWWPSRLAAAAPSHPERDRPHHLADTMS